MSNRQKQDQPERDHSMNINPSIPPEQMKKPSNQKLRPPGYRSGRE